MVYTCSGGELLRDIHILRLIIRFLGLAAHHILKLVDRVHQQVELFPPQLQLAAESIAG